MSSDYRIVSHKSVHVPAIVQQSNTMHSHPLMSWESTHTEFHSASHSPQVIPTEVEESSPGQIVKPRHQVTPSTRNRGQRCAKASLWDCCWSAAGPRRKWGMPWKNMTSFQPFTLGFSWDSCCLICNTLKA